MTEAIGAAREEISLSEEETRRIGRELALRLEAGDLVLLFGDLGSGKTALVRGLAHGLGADPGEVASPTFALVHEYGPPERTVLLHADLYRLADGGSERSLEDLGLEEGLRRGAVVAIEWPREPFLSMAAWRISLREIEGGARMIRIEPPTFQS
ncbi:MAG: tRNA (adenosine(37)-N6)-threonylcarbamoyltransferase complex ATPase subunit type 1 TsaE [Thermoanaerobaculia bacterium]